MCPSTKKKGRGWTLAIMGSRRFSMDSKATKPIRSRTPIGPLSMKGIGVRATHFTGQALFSSSQAVLLSSAFCPSLASQKNVCYFDLRPIHRYQDDYRFPAAFCRYTYEGLEITFGLNPPPLVEDPDRFYRSGENCPWILMPYTGLWCARQCRVTLDRHAGLDPASRKQTHRNGTG